MKRTAALIASALLATTALVGCAPSTEKPGGSDNEFGLATTIDKNRYTLFVSNFNGAFGERWLKAAIKRYEELHKNDDYDGKKGVQVWVDNAKQGGKDILAGIDSNRDAVFFSEFVFASEFASSGKILDLSSIINTELTEYNESKSIKDKMTDEQTSYFVTSDNKCYVLPHYQAFRGLTYDVELFEDELLYLAADKDNGNDGFIMSLTDKMSNGPDGKENTYDDGLPATYDEFFKLCDRMVDYGINPVIWSGSNQAYFTEYLASLALDYEGIDDAMLNFTFDGKANHLVDMVNDDGTVTLKPATDIKTKDGYMLTKQAGKYYSLQFAERLLQSKYIASGSMDTLSHTDAQKNYINSKLSSSMSTIGMILESTFWENECSDMNYFNIAAKQYGEKYSRKNRRFGFMPFPKATEEQVGEVVTLTDYLNSGTFIRGNATGVEKELALDFVRFLYTDESLREFTLYTGCPKAMNYDIDDIKDEISPYSRSVFEMKQRADIVYPYSSNAIYAENPATFAFTSFYSTVVHQGQGNTPYTMPSRAIYDYKVTAKQYFEGLSVSLSKSSWDSQYSKYFG